jgi:hypothetical protein
MVTQGNYFEGKAAKWLYFFVFLRNKVITVTFGATAYNSYCFWKTFRAGPRGVPVGQLFGLPTYKGR